MNTEGVFIESWIWWGSISGVKMENNGGGLWILVLFCRRLKKERLVGYETLRETHWPG